MVLKIKPSTMQVKQSRPVNVTQLAIPISFAQQIGANVSAAGKEFEKIKKEQKLIEDQNRFYELVGAQQKIIDKGLYEASQMTNLEMAETSLAKAYEIDVSSENKEVQSLVNTYINKEKLKNQSLLYKSVMSRAAEENREKDIEFLNRNLLDRTNTDPGIRAAADKELAIWSSSPTQLAKYGAKELRKLTSEYEFLKQETLTNLNIKSAPLKVMLSEKEIIEEFGPQKGVLYLNKARNKFVSDATEELLANDKEIDEREFNQITTFTELGVRIIDDKNRPSIDEMHDILDQGKINTAQYNALLDLYLNPDKVSDFDFINRINNQIVIADNVNELDDVQNVYSSSRDFLENTTIKDTAVLSKLIKTLKEDPTKHDQYKDFYKRLRINLGDLEGALQLYSGAGGITTEDKEMTQDALSRFNNYVVNDGLSPENAYLKVIAKIGEDKIPDLYSPNLIPLNYDISNIADAIKKDPDNYFNNINNDLAKQFKSGKITRSEFLEDVARVDLLKDVYEVRLRVLGNVDAATKKSEKKRFNLITLQQEIKDNN